MKPNIIIIAALENGKIASEYFSDLAKGQKINILKVFTYEDEEVPNKNMFVPLDDIIPPNILTKVKNINQFKDEISIMEPDFIFVIGWSQLIDKEILSSAKQGTIGFHTSKLPKDRGRSTLAWQIAEGYKETALTMLYLEEGIDNGDIIAQEIIKISENDNISNILIKINRATYNLLTTYFPLLLKGMAPRIKQDENLTTYRRLRTDNDSFINWNSNSEEIYNLIRAVSYPYPKAWTIFQDKKIKINKAKMVNFIPEGFYFSDTPGTILGILKDFGYLIKTKDGMLAITDFEPEEISLMIGERLGE